MIKTAIDTESIWKHIWNELYRIITKTGSSQTDIAKKIWIKPNSVSVLLTWKVTTRNLEQYWRIAEAIPITRKEFDEIVQEAKEKVLWKAPEEDVEVAFFAKKWITDKTKQDAILKMIDAFKDV